MISRPFYIDWLKRWAGKDLVKVLTGMRRCGKSTILEMFQSELIQSGVEESHILSINFESFEEEYPLEARPLYKYVTDRLGKKGMNYVFLDEIQRVNDFESVVNALHAKDNVDLYITGSNAYFLSGDFATYLTGRQIEIKVYPLSFKEYRSALEQGRQKTASPLSSKTSSYVHSHTYGEQLTKEELFDRYLTYGGLPYTTRLNDTQEIASYLEGVFSTILTKDIFARRPKMDTKAFKYTTSFLADNIGNISSVKKISDVLSDEGKNVSQGAVSEYVTALLETFLVYKVDRYDVRGKEYLRTLEKYYLGDLGFRLWLLGKTTGDVGRRLENLVYLELLRRYNHVSIGKLDKVEVDFVTKDNQGLSYVQVAQTVMDEKTLQRELKPLHLIDDNYPKTLLTLDVVGTGDDKGVKHINLIDWLLQ